MSKVALPVQLIDGEFIVQVTINGHGLDFILDSGADGIALDDGVATQLGLTRFAKSSNAANAGRVPMSTAIVPAMSVGALQMHDVAVSAVPGLSDDYRQAKVVGLLGFDFIAELLLELDYEKGTVTASHGDFESAAPLPPGSIVLDVRLPRFRYGRSICSERCSWSSWTRSLGT